MKNNKCAILMIIFLFFACSLIAKPKKSSWLDEASNEVKSSRGGAGNLQIERSLDFNTTSGLNENIKKKLPDFMNMRKKATKTVTEKKYDVLGSLMSEKKVLEEQSFVATQTEEINSIADRLKAINNAIQQLIKEKQASDTKSLELND